MKDKLKKLMDERHETAYQVSKATGFSQTAIGCWLNGDYEPKLEALKALSNHFDVPITYFIEP